MSDWSSDVCSSDLGERALQLCRSGHERQVGEAKDGRTDAQPQSVDGNHQRLREVDQRIEQSGETVLAALEVRIGGDLLHLEQVGAGAERPPLTSQQDHGDRSEEHTSELQSLMRISYAVFCLNKKKKEAQSIYTLEITIRTRVE